MLKPIKMTAPTDAESSKMLKRRRFTVSPFPHAVRLRCQGAIPGSFSNPR
jgi:hypothetical protein